MVHFPGFARARLWIQRAVRRFYRRGFPHSDIPGSKPACGSPRLIAACHVLHRHLPPRHPPCALSSLTIKFPQRTPLAGRAPSPFHGRAIRPSLSSPVYRDLTRADFGTPKNLLSAPPNSQFFSRRGFVDCPIYSVVKHRPPPPGRECRASLPKVRNRHLAGSQPWARRSQESVVGSFAIPLTTHYQLLTTGSLVELTGIEPVTPCLQSRCSPS